MGVLAAAGAWGHTERRFGSHRPVRGHEPIEARIPARLTTHRLTRLSG